MAVSGKSFRYKTANRWFKGNTHIHSVASDGGMSVPDIAELYSTAQFDFLFCTDHWVSSNVADSCKNPPLLLLDGLEIDGEDSTGAYFHVVCLGKTSGIAREDGFENALAEHQTVLLDT